MVRFITVLAACIAVTAAYSDQPKCRKVNKPDPNNPDPNTGGPDDPRYEQWQAPGPGDVRSPCPGLNALANHGFINRNGKGLTIPDLIVGLKTGLNVGADFTTAIGTAGLFSNPNPLGGSFDLDNLDQHNFPTEHDGSLSRQDAYFGDDHTFYQPNWDMVLQAYAGKTLTDIPSAALARRNRILDSQKINPEFTYGFRELILSLGETALYLQTMGDPTANGVARLDFVRSLFEKEKLPYDLGWRRAQNEINLATLSAQGFQIYSAGPDPVVEGFEVGAMTYKNVLQLVQAGQQVIGNYTLPLTSSSTTTKITSTSTSVSSTTSSQPTITGL